jgi:hypothetical protein
MLLAIPASTAPSERVFSNTGFFDKRARGQSQMVPLLAFIRGNVPLLSPTATGQVEAITNAIDQLPPEKERAACRPEDIHREDEIEETVTEKDS